MPHARELLKILGMAVAGYVAVHVLVAQPFEVRQDSMMPTVLDGDFILVDKLSPAWQDYRRGDVVVFVPPEDAGSGLPFIKRVIGLPGDVIRLEAGIVVVDPPDSAPVRLAEPYVNGSSRDGGQAVAWVVPEGSIFVLGDNRAHSLDSRAFGPIDRDAVLGRAWLRYYPLDRLGTLAPTGSVRAMSSD
jgi:signal peptidase I